MPTPRQNPQDANGWRQLAQFQLRQHEERLESIERRIQASDEKHTTRFGLVEERQGKMNGEISGLRVDIVRMGKELDEGRRSDVEALKQSLQSTRNLMIAIGAPIIAAVVGGLLLLALTGSPH